MSKRDPLCERIANPNGTRPAYVTLSPERTAFYRQFREALGWRSGLSVAVGYYREIHGHAPID